MAVVKTSPPKTSKPVSKTKSTSSSKPVKKTKSQQASETTPPPTPTPEVANDQVEAPQNVSSVPPEAVTLEVSMTQTLTTFQETITSLTLALNKLKSDFKVLEKQVIKEARSMDKVNAKRNKNKGSRAPSGFVKPASISSDLAKFLNVSNDTKMARTDVTKLITAYVKENKLQAPDNGRKIIPDKKLMALLGCTAKDEVTYFNLQSYMKPHFIKDENKA